MAKQHCPLCGSSNVTTETPSEYQYKESGLSYLWIRGKGGVTIVSCLDCNNTTTLVQREQQLLQVIGLGLLERPPGMTGEELRYLRTLFNMTQSEFAKATRQRRHATISDWERSKRVTQRIEFEIFLRLILLDLFREHVIESDRCFLEKPHLKRYRKLVDSFVEHGMKMLGPKSKRRRVQIRHRPKKKEWEPELVGA